MTHKADKLVDVTPRTYVAMIVHNKAYGTYSIFLPDEKGGPIISDSNLESAKARFQDALSLALAVRNLRVYNEAVEAVDNEERIRITEMLGNLDGVEYRQLHAA